MSENKEALESVLSLVKSLKDEVAVLKEQGKTVSEKSEKIAAELFAKREQAMQQELMNKFRKGEHLEPINDEAVRPEEIIVSKSADPKVRRLQELNDDIYLVAKATGLHPRQTRIWKESQAQVTELRKALNVTTSTEGLNWVPTEFSADLTDKFRLSLKVAALFPRMNMPSNPYTLPIVGGDATPYLASESTSDSASKLTASQPTADNVTLTAKKLAVRTLFSEEMSEDAIIPVLPMLKDHIVRVMTDGMENALINGDSSGSGFAHMDHTLVTSAADVRKAYLGLRKHAKTSNVPVTLSTFNLANVRSIRTAMGKYGVNPADLAWITGPKGYNKLLGLDEVTTKEKYGDAATILQGELGRLDGIPIIVSEHVLENLSTTGYYDGTTTNNTVLLLVHRPSFIIGDRRKMTLKTFEDIQVDQTVLVATMRAAFDSIRDESTEVIANVGIDIATS